jgi:hypothetical protein
MVGVRIAIAAVIVLALAGAARAQQGTLDQLLRAERTKDIETRLATVEQVRRAIESNFAAAGDPRLRGAFASAMDTVEALSGQLEQLTAVTDAAVLERALESWQATGQLTLLDAVVVFGRMIAERKIPIEQRYVSQWNRFGQTAIGLVRANGNAPFDRVEDLPRLKTELARLRFVRAVRGAGERIEQTQAAIQSLEARVAQQRETAQIVTRLEADIAAGKTDAALEQRIAALPPDARATVEAARKAAEDSKSRTLSQAREDQARQETALARQREIDEAIRLRKQEIESGKANPAAEQARQKDAGLARAVKVWEDAYRQARAEQKAGEARQKLAEAERAKAEAERQRAAVAATQRAQEAADRRAATVRKYDIKGTIDVFELQANPFQYQNQAMILQGARFQRMMDQNAGLFAVGRDQQIYVSKLPSSLFTRTNESRPLVVRVRGLMQGTNALGAGVQVPHLEYLSVWNE